MRDVYKRGFDFKALQPVFMTEGRAIIKGIVPSDFDQIIGTDHLNEMHHCKIWEVLSVSDGVKQIEKGDVVLVLKAGIDKIDPDSPRHGVVPCDVIAAKMNVYK